MKSLNNVAHLRKYTIYALVILAMLIPLVKPIGLPVKITEDTEGFYAAMEEFNPGDVVLWDIHFQLSSANELTPQITAMAYHLAQRGAKCIIVSMHPEAYPFALDAMEEFKRLGKDYGTDMVYLGYLPGEEVAVASLLSDMHQTVPTDYEGTPIASHPLMANVKTGDDLTAVVSINTSGPGSWTRQLPSYKNVDLLYASIANTKTTIQTYLDTGQIKASLDGARCTAEYEQLLERPGKALALQDASSCTFLVFLGLVVAGNVFQRLKPSVSRKGDAK